MSTYYIAVKDVSRSNCENINQYYIDKFPVSNKARSASVYDMCKNTECSYVLKVIVYDNEKFEKVGTPYIEKDYIQKSWENEVSVLKKLNECQESYGYKFSPELYDYWYCENNLNVYFYILMEKFEGNLKDFMKKYKDVASIKIAAVQSMALLEKDLTIIIHEKCGVCLNDIKLDNILYKQLDEYVYEFVFADTGLSTFETNDKCKREDTEKFRRQIREFQEGLKVV